MMDTKAHWTRVYATKAVDEVSWFQRDAHVSLELIQQVAPDRASRILDAGGGASTLVDGLLESGYLNVTVLDLSPRALEQARLRLGNPPPTVKWLEADILTVALPQSGFDLWHDRAVFHFLQDDSERRRYVAQVRQSVRPGGHVIVATFASDGPTQCSGLPVVRYTPESLQEQFAPGFKLLRSVREEHVTPTGGRQPFLYCAFEVEQGSSVYPSKGDIR